MKTIHKYPLLLVDFQEVTTHDGADILCVKLQNGRPCLWAMVDDKAPETVVTIRCAGTGHDLNTTPNLRYIDSVLMHNDSLVLHFFLLD